MIEIVSYKVRKREFQVENEEKFLSPYACKSNGANTTRLIEEENDEFRTPFQRDRDRILHSKAFRRLKHKRQVFFTDYGDHYRTRLTHTLEVSQLSRTVSRILGLNEDLIEAIALGHDLGHTPFGHIGEEILNAVLTGKDNLNNVINTGNIGGFKHNYQSLRVVDYLERRYDFKGLNLTSFVREGILKHTDLKKGSIFYPEFNEGGLYMEYEFSVTIEGQVVAICDEIAQRTHDLEDGIRSGFIDLGNVRELALIKRVEKQCNLPEFNKKNKEIYRNTLIRKLISLLIKDISEETIKNINKYYDKTSSGGLVFKQLVMFSPQIDREQKELDVFIDKEIINNSAINKADAKSEHIIRNLLISYLKKPLLLEDVVIKDFLNEKFGNNVELRKMSGEKVFPYIEKIKNEPKFIRLICDYIAGMTDNFALNEYSELFSV
ncbi:deoxyguanosinetriphosphate triphosphohydrolase [candidate division KSB1 bacterium]|nr:MAG: deoxyguanosinetriphosphate triphosphohydrolase [candidate division KSB1 bacterium]